MKKLVNRIKKNEILTESLKITGIVLYSILCASIIIMITIKIINNPLLEILCIIILIFLFIFLRCIM